MRPLTSSPAVRAIRRRLARMKHRRLVVLAACAAALLGATAAPAAADDVNRASIVYSDTYNKLIAAFPPGYADSCAVAVFLHPGAGTICTTTIELVYFYPDGTTGPRAWVIDPSSPTGWSVAPDPCDGLTAEEYELWATYVDFTNGYFDAGPDLTAEQIDRYGACWGWWF